MNVPAPWYPYLITVYLRSVRWKLSEIFLSNISRFNRLFSSPNQIGVSSGVSSGAQQWWATRSESLTLLTDPEVPRYEPQFKLAYMWQHTEPEEGKYLDQEPFWHFLVTLIINKGFRLFIPLSKSKWSLLTQGSLWNITFWSLSCSRAHSGPWVGMGGERSALGDFPLPSSQSRSPKLSQGPW